MEFCHIAPIHNLELVKGRPAHLTLAHLIEKSDTYTAFYRDRGKGEINIMDNSAFEMYKQRRPMYNPDKLLEMAKRVKADYIVMSDYPNEPGDKTIDSAKILAPRFKDEGFGTFFCPQSKIGDKEDLIDCWWWAAESDLVDYIGVSILAVPNAYGVEKGNKLQRFLSRWSFMDELEGCGILQEARANGKKIHFLGMTDGPNEIDLVKEYWRFIDTWDSSAAVWAGLNGIRFDNSPSGLVYGKFEKEVDFFAEIDDNIDIVKVNMYHIDAAIDYFNRLYRLY